ncbi:MAG: asparagine synthase (glutamine-hydrolyzing) [Ignavibacteria bacterium]
MCGIAGFYSGNITKFDSDKVLSQMLEITHHRGPENAGKYFKDGIALGHNRLSIIDLSAEANEPFHYQDLVLTFNGEIYNYIELRSELKKLNYCFRTQSDTEVITAAYKEWGTECVKRFIGMWAFALWDETKKELFCSRDRFGIKPFLYIKNNKDFYFASEIKALQLTPAYTNQINLQQVYRGLQLGWLTYEDETYFEVIKNLPPAHNLTLKNGEAIIEKYWDITDFGDRKNISFEEKKNEFHDLFFDSIKLHNRSDVPLGVCLSGGLDSSAMASALSIINGDKKIKSFTAYYEGMQDKFDERPFVREVISKYPNLTPYYISPTNKDIENSFDDIFNKFSIPINGSSLISHYFVMKLAKQEGVTVTIDGQGADEILGGYLHTFYRLFADEFSRLRLFKGISLINNYKHYHNYDFKKTVDIYSKSFLSTFFNENSLYHLEYKYNGNVIGDKNHKDLFFLKHFDTTKVNNFLYHNVFHTSLPSILYCVDFNSMSYSIESRVPFLDHRIVELCFTLPNDFKINNSETKYIMRRSLEKILPKKITERRDKKGFVTPGEVHWLRGYLSHLLDIDYSRLDFIDKKKTQALLSDFKNGNNRHSSTIWRLAMLNRWMKRI